MASSRRVNRKKQLGKYRSKLEIRVAELIPDALYESTKLKYIIPASNHTYLTDFELGPNSYIEVKGRLLASERKKYLLVREHNPEITLRFFFDKADNKIYKGSPTTYAAWCEANGFSWTDSKRGIPPEWLNN